MTCQEEIWYFGGGTWRFNCIKPLFFFPATSCSSLATSKIIDSPLSKVPTPEYQTLIQIQKGPPPTSSAFSLQANRKDAWSKKRWTNLLQKPIKLKLY